MRIVFNETQQASPNGADVYTYEAGVEYTETSEPPMSASLAVVLLAYDLARDLDASPAPKATKVAGPAATK
jgi:hypothetical protein